MEELEQVYNKVTVSVPEQRDSQTFAASSQDYSLTIIERSIASLSDNYSTVAYLTIFFTYFSLLKLKSLDSIFKPLKHREY